MEREYSHRPVTFLNMFNQCVANNPETIALRYNNESLSYKELDNRSSCIASGLAGRGINTGSIIGIFFDRSIEMLVAVVGILKAGCAYLPIDTKYPLKRIEHLIQDSKIKNILTTGQLSSTIKETAANCQILLLSDMLTEDHGIIDNFPEISYDTIAYVIYTSASTGKAKGVVVSHGNLACFINSMKSVIAFDHGETLLMLAPISFDLSISETLLPLASGLTVVIANDREQRDPEAFAEVILRHGVTMFHSTPSRLKAFLTVPDKSYLDGVKILLVGGEEFSIQLFETIKAFFNKKLYNLYGPTETTVWSTYKDLSGTKELNIGRALPGYYVYILDENNQPCEIENEGEICIGGTGVAQGYINDKFLTERKFVKDIRQPGGIMYRTGDIGKINAEGDLVYLGRVDNQIKVRGYRVDLSEVETRLLKVDGIEDAVVTFNFSNLGDKIITAYFVSNVEIPVNRLKEELLKDIPDYMVPLNFNRIEKIPLTFNGKIDYKSLQNFVSSTATFMQKDEEDLVKRDVMNIWNEILERNNSNLDDGFFQAGGHSLSAIFLINTITEKYKIKFPLSMFLERPTLGSLIDIVKGLSGK